MHRLAEAELGNDPSREEGAVDPRGNHSLGLLESVAARQSCAKSVSNNRPDE